MLEDLAPGRVTMPRGWIAHYINSGRSEPPVGAGGYAAVPKVKVASGESDLQEGDAARSIVIPTDPELLSQLADLTGNAAIGLFLLVRLLYISAFNLEPRSPAFVVIWQDMHPARGQGP